MSNYKTRKKSVFSRMSGAMHMAIKFEAQKQGITMPHYIQNCMIEHFENVKGVDADELKELIVL